MLCIVNFIDYVPNWFGNGTIPFQQLSQLPGLQYQIWRRRQAFVCRRPSICNWQRCCVPDPLLAISPPGEINACALVAQKALTFSRSKLLFLYQTLIF